MKINKITDETELEEAFGFRKKVFVEREGVPEKHERDPYDARSHHFTVRDKAGAMVGYFRLIPIETRNDMFRGFCDMPSGFCFEEGKVLEFSRVASVAGRNSILFKILFFIHEYARDIGVEFFCGTIRVELLEALKRKGWKFIYLGNLFDYEGVWKVAPFICKVSDNCN